MTALMCLTPSAIIEFADNHMLALAPNDETGALIQLLKWMT
ncbi:hypothetical protein FB001_12143 [Ensifer sp. SEMIA 135]|nr:hypothetical protein FB000_12488 [Ensifer sp. SEMIA 134]TWB30067.1 hypothetical protein FB001_12143 [Ensifer sp. SEMIA 135]